MTLQLPLGMSVQFSGYSRQQPLNFYPPPAIPLKTEDPGQILELLEYADITHRSPECDAAHYGIKVFCEGRRVAWNFPMNGVLFDWDHTLSNYKIFEPIVRLIRTRFSRTPPHRWSELPMTAIEAPRPFMLELAFGMMVGYAEAQGLKGFDQWEQYEPQVGLFTNTWPDRIGIMATHFVRLLPLMAGILPGTEGIYDTVVRGEGKAGKAFTHLHHFHEFANRSLDRFERDGWSGLDPEQAVALSHFMYVGAGKAHHDKPLGALAARGWELSKLLFLDDSLQVIEAISRIDAKYCLYPVHVPNPYADQAQDVGELDKILPSALLRSRHGAVKAATDALAVAEAAGSRIEGILHLLGYLSSVGLYSQAELSWEQFQQRTRIVSRTRQALPDGVHLLVHETPTDLGTFWQQYVSPQRMHKQRIRQFINDNKDTQVFSGGNGL